MVAIEAMDKEELAMLELTDKEFIQKPDDWPYWPFLPVKRPKDAGFPEIGVILAIGGKLSTVYLVNINADSLEERIKISERKEYPNVDAMLADGWIVD